MRACALGASVALITAAGLAVALPAAAEGSPRTGPVLADVEPATASAGIYRIPFEAGTGVTVAQIRSGSAVYAITPDAGADVVAAAAGWIRAVAEQGAPGGGFVWIEHPNGEFTRYAGLAATVEARAEGDWIDAGDILGSAPAAGGGAVLWEVAAPAVDGLPLAWSADDGAVENGIRFAPLVCGVPGADLVGDHIAAACDHAPPTASLGAGPLVVDEGQSVTLDARGSIDPDGEPLTYRWETAAADLAPVAQPVLTVADDFTGPVTLHVHDRIEQVTDDATVELVVRNVPPAVEVVPLPSDEGGIGRIRATVTDPGDDTLAAQIDWGDGGAPQAVTIAELAAGVDHAYGDDGAFPVTVTVTDDDGGVGAHAVALEMTNVAPAVTLEVGGVREFPGGVFAVVPAGGTLRASATATDPGSDDLVFAWSGGKEFLAPVVRGSVDPPLSPSGTSPVRASHEAVQVFTEPGVDILRVAVRDDDGGTTDAAVRVIVTAAASSPAGTAWWVHELAGTGRSELSPALVARYLDTVQAVSQVFSESTPAATPADAIAVLAARDDDARAAARAELLCAWLAFAGGSVAPDAVITRSSGAEVAFLDLMADAEASVDSALTSDGKLAEIADDLSRAMTALG
ncbi:hypothetical protein OB08_08085 [Microbacterium sp. HJ5]